MTPPDPVRPVAPREDENVLSLHRCKVCGTAWLQWPDAIHGGGWNLLDKYQRPGACCDNAAMGDQIEHLRDIPLAAAPVPCAASPADQRFADLLADLRTVESIYQKDRVAHFYASTIENIFDKWLYDDEPEPESRATGEGARDGIEDRSERVDSVGRGGDAANADGPADRGGDDRRGASDRGAEGQASPVAVSLDPHRLRDRVKLMIERFRALGGIPELCDHAWELCCENERLHTELARLRGEASK
jgi:hypothetical protein